MNRQQKKNAQRMRRKLHIRRSIFGSVTKPRLSVFRSHQNIYCQLIDDGKGVTLAAASTRSKELRDQLKGKAGNRAASTLVGALIAEKAKGLGITAVAFDRNGYRFHGRVRALAEAAREAGLKF